MVKKFIFLLLFLSFLFCEVIFDLKFSEDIILLGRVKTGDEKNPIYVDIVGSDFEIGKIENIEGLFFKRDKKHHCIILNSEKLLKEFSDEINIEFTFLYKSTENFDEKNRGGVHSIISQYEVFGDKRSFSIYLWEDTETKKSNINFSISNNGKDVITFSTPAILEPEKIYNAKISFKIGEYVKIYVNDQLKCDKKLEIKEIFKSEIPISIGCRFYNSSPINFFNGILFKLKIYKKE
jgi:hypothetical protein